MAEVYATGSISVVSYVKADQQIRVFLVDTSPERLHCSGEPSAAINPSVSLCLFFSSVVRDDTVDAPAAAGVSHSALTIYRSLQNISQLCTQVCSKYYI